METVTRFARSCRRPDLAPTWCPREAPESLGDFPFSLSGIPLISGGVSTLYPRTIGMGTAASGGRATDAPMVQDANSAAGGG